MRVAQQLWHLLKEFLALPGVREILVVSSIIGAAQRVWKVLKALPRIAKGTALFLVSAMAVIRSPQRYVIQPVVSYVQGIVVAVVLTAFFLLFLKALVESEKMKKSPQLVG